MLSASKLMAIGFTIALALADAGTLPNATKQMATLAAGPRMLSLGKLNRALMGGYSPHRPVHNIGKK